MSDERGTSGLMSQQFRIGEFSSKAGVTVRTVRYYDKLGLLKPSGYSEARQRLYTELDFARLQQILTLKLIGLSLDEIKQLLTTDVGEIQQLLARQKNVLEAQANQLASVIRTIDKAQQVMTASQSLDLDQLINIIKAVNMTTQSDWFDQFVTAEQKAKLVPEGTLAQQKQVGQAWQRLFQDVTAHLNDDVNDPAVQALVKRWDDLMGQIAQNDPQLAAQLNQVYAQIDTLPGIHTAPQDVQDWTQSLCDAAAFIEKARAANKP
jgi:MerR family transcriptional regulator, thiopeptide resistance regulator